MNQNNIQEYIDICINEACVAENRENDIKTDYRIIGNQFLFAIQSKYMKVSNIIEDRLLLNFEKNFHLKFNLVFPDSFYEHLDCFMASQFDLFGYGRCSVDPNYTIDKWVVFGHAYTIRCRTGIRYQDELGIPHLEKLKANGYDNEVDTDFDKFVSAYQSAYGMTPIEWYINIYTKNLQKAAAVLNNRKQYNLNEVEHDCGYWSVCDECGHACPCSPSAKVNKGFDNELWNRMKHSID